MQGVEYLELVRAWRPGLVRSWFDDPEKRKHSFFSGSSHSNSFSIAMVFYTKMFRISFEN
jgi:hypothetical protein